LANYLYTYIKAEPAFRYMVDNYREPEDFLSDDSFLTWYFKTGPEQEKAWDLWISANPDRKELVQQAVELLNATLVPEKEVPLQQVRKAEDSLMQKIKALPQTQALPQGQTQPQGQAHPQALVPAEADPSNIGSPAGSQESPSRYNSLFNERLAGGKKQENLPEQPAEAIPTLTSAKVITPFRWMAAATVLILLTSGLLLTRFFRSRRPEVRTEYGQVSQQHLPDGTEVIMNANSRLTYSSGWEDGTDREVWVNGEAFFHVTKTPLKSRFIVHTDQFDVIVTGTQFNVVNRNHEANVMLQEGSVIINTKDGKTLHMVPGDFVEFKNTRQLEKIQVKDDSLLAWREQKLVFNKTPLKDIATIINEQYGVPVKLAVGEECPYMQTVSGIMPNNNLDVLLQALVATSEFNVTRASGNDTITIKSHCQ
jgi:ferric-dicitrate binding protein FerR (iron transport regulator)